MPWKCTLKMVNFVYGSPQLKPQIHKNQKAGYQSFLFCIFFFFLQICAIGTIFGENKLQ